VEGSKTTHREAEITQDRQGHGHQSFSCRLS
jgi:hypothetical protein